MSESADLMPHRFEFVNDEFRVAIDATCPLATWRGLVHDVVASLSKPVSIITFPKKLSLEEAEAVREKFTRRWPA